MSVFNRLFFVLLLLLAGASAGSLAQAPGEASEELKEGGGVNPSVASFWARAGKSGFRKPVGRPGNGRKEPRVRYQSVDVEVFFSVQPPLDYEVEAIFFVKDEFSKEFYIFDYYGKKMRFQSAKLNFEITPAVGTVHEIVQEQTDLPASKGVFNVTIDHQTMNFGSDTYGWVVRFKNPGSPDRIETNQVTLKEMAVRRPEEFQQKVEAFLSTLGRHRRK